MRRSLTTLLALALMLAAVLAVVDGDAAARRRPRRRRPTPVAAPKSEAAKVFAQGEKLFKGRDYHGALEAFEQAYKLGPHFLLQCNIARCHERLSDMVAAGRHYQRCLGEGGAKGKMGVKVKAALVQVEARISWVLVRSPGRGGVVYVDGTKVGRAPQRVAVNPGNRVVEVRRSGATPATTTVATRGGEARTLDLTPTDVKRPIDAPRPLFTTDEGSGRRRPRDGERRERRGLHPAIFWTGVAITAGLAVGATVVGVQALRAKTGYDDNPTRGGYETAKDKRLIANILFGAVAAAAGTSTTLFFFTDFRGKRRAAEADDVAFGVGLRGTF